MNEQLIYFWIIETERILQFLKENKEACQQYGDIIKQAIQSIEQL